MSETFAGEKDEAPGRSDVGFDSTASEEDISHFDSDLEDELSKASEAPELGSFYYNLAEKLSDNELTALGVRFHDLYLVDKDSRSARDKRQRDAIDSQGLQGNERTAASEGDGMEGGSIVAHPGFLQASILYTSQIVTELLPADGPVRTHIVGEITGEKLEKADRKARHMNWQLTQQAPEFFDEFESMQSQVPAGGCQFMMVWWDGQHKRPCFKFIPTERVFVPFETSWFYGARRICVEIPLTRADIEERVASGMYLDEIPELSSVMPEETQSEQATNRTTGRSQPTTNPDDIRLTLWFSVYDDLVGDGVHPYLMEIDEQTRRVLCIYRNWAEDDEKERRLNWLIKFPFLATRDAYDLSLYSVLSSLDVAATGALRALLDSALVNTTPTLLALEGANLSGQNQNIMLTQVNKLEGALGVDDIRKVAMPVPFNQPSPALFQLLGFLSEQAEKMVRITLDDSSVDSNANTPVGTQLSRVEQGLKVFKAIHARNHRAMAMLLDTLHTLNKLYLDEKDLVLETGERLARRADYEGPMDVAPVSDPAIFSEQQRTAQVQAVVQSAMAAAANPLTAGIYDYRKVEEYKLKTLKIPNWEELLVKPQTAEFQNAVNENMMLMLTRPVVAFPSQDHVAHLETHVSFMMNPIFGGNPAITPSLLAPMLKHMLEHLGLWYVNDAYEQVTNAAGRPAEELLDTKSPELLRKFDRMLAAAQPIVFNDAKTALGNLPVIIQQATQMVGQLQQQQMQTQMQMQGGPQAMAVMKGHEFAFQLGQARLQAEDKWKQMELQVKGQQTMVDGQSDQQRNQLEAMKVQESSSLKRDELTQAASIERADMFRQAARDKAEFDIANRELAADGLLQAQGAQAEQEQARLDADLATRKEAEQLALERERLAQADQLNARDNAVRIQLARESNEAQRQQADNKQKD